MHEHAHLPSATEADLKREAFHSFWNPGKQLLRSIRNYQAAKERSGLLSTLKAKAAVLQHRFWSVCASADIPVNCQLGGGFKLVHSLGVVIHPSAKIGVNAAVFQQVTIVGGVEIGGQVEIGAGAKIIRAVKIGDRVKIGANAVVLCDVPDGATVVGVPGKVILAK